MGSQRVRHDGVTKRTDTCEQWARECEDSANKGLDF